MHLYCSKLHDPVYTGYRYVRVANVFIFCFYFPCNIVKVRTSANLERSACIWASLKHPPRVFRPVHWSETPTTLFNFKQLLRRDFFYLLDYVTRRSEKLGFQKKKKKKRFCLAPLQNCSFLASSEITKKIYLF